MMAEKPYEYMRVLIIERAVAECEVDVLIERLCDEARKAM